MLHDFDGFDLVPLLDQATPGDAMAAIAARFDALGGEHKTRLREAVIASLEHVFGSAARAKRDWFEVLLETPDLLGPERGVDPLPTDGKRIETRLCDLLLATLDDMAPEERGERAATAALRSRDISLLCALVMASEHNRDASYLGAASPDVRKALLDRIGGLAATSAFWAQRFPAALLWFWFTHGEEQRVYLFTSRAMDDPSGLEALLTLPLERNGSGAEQQDVVAARRWSRIIDFRALEARAVQLAMTAPSRDDRRRARRFLDAFAAGKSELFR